MSQQVLEQFKAEVRKCLTLAGERYGLEEQMKLVKIRLDIRGYRVAGQACRKGFQFSLRFHPDAIVKHYDEMVKDTIPHEVAHTVCQMNPTLGKNHDAGWKRVCRALGGDDSRTHDMKFGEKPVRKECWYRTSTGHVVDLGPIRHAKLQSNKFASYRCRGQGTVKAEGYIGNTKPGQSQPQPEQEMAASTKATKTQPGSKAEQARAYTQALIEQGQSQEQLLTDKGIHAKHLHVALEFGTLGAARSCFVANTKKLFN